MAKTKKKPAPKKKKTTAKKLAPKKKTAPKKKRASSGPRKAPMNTAQPELESGNEVFVIFKRFDRDGSGSIDRGELAALLEALNQSPALGDDLGEEELDVAMISIDTNDSGRISWDEFQAWWSSR